jgi:NAD(P)-dependent dehydrogenase (short-subunit alcohol dehydrogenase family)
LDVLSFQGKVVAVTGGGGGIGRAITHRFARAGAKVAVCDLDGAAGEEVAASIRAEGGETVFFRMDVTDRTGVPEVFRAIAETFCGLDILINNAGINVGPDRRVPLPEFDDADWDAILRVDLDGVYHCAKAAVPYLRMRGGGSILNIGSVVGLVPFRNQCAFAAAKAGVTNLTRAMALELAPDGIRVNLLAPGTVAMDKTMALWANDDVREALLSHIPQHRQGTPDEIAGPALFLSSEALASYVTGAVLTVDGGWTCGYARDF